ncbi:MAG: 2-oxoacid:acceptor oxidoreductase subunit alpha [Elusimicrobia bacterium]|nr:2-oxoacid:acceptor oxidoreductase subunit alpha [Elusimicrobiota bacterium]
MEETATKPQSNKQVQEVEAVTIRFAGDSGDGIQLTGGQFTNSTGLAGNDLSTLPDYPAEIRAPAGTLPGVSGFQIHFSSRDILTPGDAPDVLVAMNPAALKVNLKDLEQGGLVIVNTDAFTPPSLQKAGLAANPLEDGSLSNYRVIKVPLTSLTDGALKGMNLTRTQVDRCKNFFALGLMYWLYERPVEKTLAWIESKFKKVPAVLDANKKALLAGYAYADTAEMFHEHYRVKRAPIAPGRYRNLNGNTAAALGFVTAAHLAQRPLFYGSYPITPASEILHELSDMKAFGVRTFQAEDEIAAVGSTIGASFGGHLAVTGTSGPGVCLKNEAIGLAVMMELPIVIVNVQRGGPSTGLPTKTEQADLLQALFGRNGESPLAILAPATTGECFSLAIEASRIAMKYMTPVFVLSDGYLANSSEPWRIPDISKLPSLRVEPPSDPKSFKPYQRNADLSRPWAVPGMAGFEHRIGGIEKADITGNVSYDPDNHDRMIHIREQKIANIAKEIPPTQVFGAKNAEVLIVGWGSTYGAITAAVRDLNAAGKPVASIHLRHLNPLPSDLGDILNRYKRVIVPEMNLGQLVMVLRSRYLLPLISLTKVKGQPFKIHEIRAKVQSVLDGKE